MDKITPPARYALLDAAKRGHRWSKGSWCTLFEMVVAFRAIELSEDQIALHHRDRPFRAAHCVAPKSPPWPQAVIAFEAHDMPAAHTKSSAPDAK